MFLYNLTPAGVRKVGGVGGWVGVMGEVGDCTRRVLRCPSPPGYKQRRNRTPRAGVGVKIELICPVRWGGGAGHVAVARSSSSSAGHTEMSLC